MVHFKWRRVWSVNYNSVLLLPEKNAERKTETRGNRDEAEDMSTCETSEDFVGYITE